MSQSVSIMIGVFCGAVIGALLVYVVLRYRAGGKSGHAVRQELDQYRTEVGDHFDRTSELFAEMTEQYRKLYEHLSSDARNLTGRDSVVEAIETSRRIIPGQHSDERLEDHRSIRDAGNQGGLEDESESGSVLPGAAPGDSDNQQPPVYDSAGAELTANYDEDGAPQDATQKSAVEPGPGRKDNEEPESPAPRG